MRLGKRVGTTATQLAGRAKPGSLDPQSPKEGLFVVNIRSGDIFRVVRIHELE